MIEGLKPYAEYKESGQKWLGSVPAHWRTPRLKTVLREKDARSLDGSGLLLSLTRNRGLIARSDMTDKIHSARSLAGYKLYEPGEIVMNRMQAWSGMFGMGSKPGLVSPDYAVFKLLGADLVSLLLARIKAPDLVSQFALKSKGIGSGFNRLYSDRFGAIPISLPPPDEQAAIVRFLDHANRKIDGFIRAKRKLIGLLNEQKQAFIHRAVTRGLDPTVPLKPSGIPWLGDIPQHWEAQQLRHLGRFHKGVGGSKEDATPDGVPCVRYGELYFHFRNFIRQPRGFVSSAKSAAYAPIRFGDVLFAASGERVEEIGKSAVNLFTGQAVCGGDVVIFRPTVAVHAAFLGYALDSYGAAHQKATMCRGTTIKHVYPDELRGLWTCVPPVPEQERITASLDSALLGCNAAISRLEREIELLREYRTRLIADVVTGKLDVREVAATLPDPPAAAEPAPDDSLEEIETELEETNDANN